MLARHVGYCPQACRGTLKDQKGRKTRSSPEERKSFEGEQGWRERALKVWPGGCSQRQPSCVGGVWISSIGSFSMHFRSFYSWSPSFHRLFPAKYWHTILWRARISFFVLQRPGGKRLPSQQSQSFHNGHAITWLFLVRAAAPILPFFHSLSLLLSTAMAYHHNGPYARKFLSADSPYTSWSSVPLRILPTSRTQWLCQLGLKIISKQLCWVPSTPGALWSVPSVGLTTPCPSCSLCALSAVPANSASLSPAHRLFWCTGKASQAEICPPGQPWQGKSRYWSSRTELHHPCQHAGLWAGRDDQAEIHCCHLRSWWL